MARSDDLHSDLLATLAAQNVEAALISRLFDPDLALPEEGPIRVCIPDLHMLSESGQRSFPGYGFHSDPRRTDLMVRFLDALGAFAQRLPDVSQLEIYQLGDFVDLWREGPGNNPHAILATNASVWDQLYGTLAGTLQIPVYFLRGNHDFSLMDGGEFGDWQRLYAFDQTPMALLHGDVLDWFEVFAPDWLQRAIVYLTGAQSQERNFSQAELQEGTEAQHKEHESTGRYKWAKQYRLGEHFATLPQGPTAAVADNVIELGAPEQDAGPQDDLTGHELMRPAWQLVQALARTRNMAVRLMVIGHTHHARLVRYKRGQEIFVLMDCGAWTEECWVGPQGGPIKQQASCQIGVLAGNDLRLYQLQL